MQEHCPYADLYKCPRFWITQEKLDSIKLDSYEKEELIKFWDNEQYINLTSEQKPRVEFQGPDKPLYYSNLCPEAANRVL